MVPDKLPQTTACVLRYSASAASHPSASKLPVRCTHDSHVRSLCYTEETQWPHNAHLFQKVKVQVHVIHVKFNFWATVTSNGLPYATGSLSCLSVMLVYCRQRLDGSRCHLIWGKPQRRRHWVRSGPSSPHGKGHSNHHCSAHVFCGQRSPISATTELFFIQITA